MRWWKLHFSTPTKCDENDRKLVIYDTCPSGSVIISYFAYYSNLQQVYYKSYKDFSLELALPIEGFIKKIIQLKSFFRLV
jgi:hypothetical protein